MDSAMMRYGGEESFRCRCAEGVSGSPWGIDRAYDLESRVFGGKSGKKPRRKPTMEEKEEKGYVWEG